MVIRGCVALLVFGALTACEGSDTRRAREQGEALHAMAAAETTARAAVAQPSTGLWDEGLLLDRLLRAGVAPRRQPTVASGPRWMKGAPLVILAGGGEVHAWIFPDSMARRAVTDLLNPDTGTPPGETPPFPSPMRFVMQNNLAAVIFGGVERNQERIALALQAGLPVSAPGPRAP